MAKLEVLAFYVKNFGVRQGFEMYKYLGVENLPNGVISWLQADMADGDSSVDDLVEGGSTSIPYLSNKAVRHPMNDHMPTRYAKQLQYMSKESAEQYLSYKTFFNSNWTDAQVRAALNVGYKEALNSGVTTGKYSFMYLGENVTVCLEDGVFKTGYGDYVYTYNELLKLLGGE